MKLELGELRRSQVVTTFGPGSIADFRVGGFRGAPVSVVIAGLEQWDDESSARGLAHPQQISEPRLQRKLGVNGFRMPPVQPDEKKQSDLLVGVRFPRWLQCTKCERLAIDKHAGYWISEPGDPRLWCPNCSTGRRGGKAYAVPVRMVTACERGHLDEFPWEWWVHRDQRDHEPMLFLTSGRGSGIGSLFVECRASGCGRSTSLAGSFGDRAIPLDCRGHRPWLESSDECTRNLRAVQRGASNLYFALHESALSIPPWSDRIQRRLGIHWAKLVSKETSEERRQLVGLLDLDDEFGMPVSELVDLIEVRMHALEVSPDIRTEEFTRLLEAAKGGIEGEEDFQVEAEPVPNALAGRVDGLSRVTRLREVRALRGFTRLEPWASEADNERISVLSATPQRWLPAIEIRGEGIFVSLDQGRLRTWEGSPRVKSRVERLGRRGPLAATPPTGREILLHTTAHILMAELSLACGYSHAALRERLYCSSEMAGVLIYTGTPDSEGTLGGLVRQGETSRFGDIFGRALGRAEWCANDPLCADGRLSLSDVHSLAACYACALAPETSCELFNRQLDRALLVGTPGDASLGYFSNPR